jgi:hypothetical protein
MSAQTHERVITVYLMHRLPGRELTRALQVVGRSRRVSDQVLTERLVDRAAWRAADSVTDRPAPGGRTGHGERF